MLQSIVLRRLPKTASCSTHGVRVSPGKNNSSSCSSNRKNSLSADVIVKRCPYTHDSWLSHNKAKEQEQGIKIFGLERIGSGGARKGEISKGRGRRAVSGSEGLLFTGQTSIYGENNNSMNPLGVIQRGFSSSSASSTSSDMISVFDSGRFNGTDPSLPVTGLFRVDDLKNSRGFEKVRTEAVAKSRHLIDEIRSAPPDTAVVDRMDQLSDELCCVVDLAEFIRHVHPDARVRGAAEETCVFIQNYFQELNTDPTLHGSLKKLYENRAVFDSFDYETQRVVKLFMHDFEQSGIDLEEGKREQVVKLLDAITTSGMRFVQNMSEDVKFITCSRSEVQNYLPESVYNSLQTFAGQVCLDTGTATLNSVLKWVPNEALRAKLFTAAYSSNADDLANLERLLELRYELAQVVGFETYADRALSDSMAGSPVRVNEFLDGLSDQIKEKSLAELKVLAEMKGVDPFSGSVHSWDRVYYGNLVRQKYIRSTQYSIAQFFSLGTCMNGLNILFSQLYGVRLEVQKAAPGELWADDVVKLAAVHETEGEMGHIYCDFFARHGKIGQPSHFSIRCSREIGPNEYQLPIVVLLCHFRKPTVNEPTLLTHSEVETLFHEMGHAMHSMLARTKYHNCAGTRCKMDFVEIPSILMEYFAQDYRVLSEFARHHKTGELISKATVDEIKLSKSLFSGMDLQQQIFHAKIDQDYHGKHPLRASTTDILAELQNKYTVFPHTKGTSWQMFFSHLFGYGASYYTYIWSKAHASKIWSEKFAADPLNRETGDEYRRKVLRPGGAKDPNAIMEDLFGSRLDIAHLRDNLVQEVGAKNKN
eukprot:Nk52_evm45s158 gene=Nk52_evmTU45s158